MQPGVIKPMILGQIAYVTIARKAIKEDLFLCLP